MSPIAASSAIAVTMLTPGIVHQAKRVRVAERVGSEDPVELLDLARQEVDLAHASVYRQPLVPRQPDELLGQPRPAVCGRTGL